MTETVPLQSQAADGGWKIIWLLTGSLFTNSLAMTLPSKIDEGRHD